MYKKKKHLQILPDSNGHLLCGMSDIKSQLNLTHTVQQYRKKTQLPLIFLQI